ncbi:DUF4126 family protein [Spirosoma fluviale]|uniref:Uncharacterized membrane protein n=1 Tax=Spirosoma fluviale TaxID=1597977 RepID=A0A286GMJ4_9BACT|nr:DUF4126 family protein [Spirosoma fluviale]SOD96765.1 Uncharacterized membrane protein [Spirosoma fluviale]
MTQTYFKAFGLGVVIGMRAMVGPALLSRRLAGTAPTKQPKTLLHSLTQPAVVTALEGVAAAEVVTDKFPGVPNRTIPFQFGGRMVSAAVCGAFLSQVEEGEIPLGAAAGAVGAIAGTLAFFRLRQWLTHSQGVADPVVALVEDALCIGGGWAIVNRVEPVAQPV